MEAEARVAIGGARVGKVLLEERSWHPEILKSVRKLLIPRKL